MASSKKYIYTFGKKKSEGKASMKNLLGGKGANLAEMSSIGIPVPSGFTITTEVCTYFYANRNKYPSVLKIQVKKALEDLRDKYKNAFHLRGVEITIIGENNDTIAVTYKYYEKSKLLIGSFFLIKGGEVIDNTDLKKGGNLAV